ncbi:MAG: hypothetical protein RI565_10545, partial [Schleiferiaceae bacterium]|nr:hypothetical protein [Schleiferiaceae bacterium]
LQEVTIELRTETLNRLLRTEFPEAIFRAEVLELVGPNEYYGRGIILLGEEEVPAKIQFFPGAEGQSRCDIMMALN